MSEPFVGEIRIVAFDFPPKGWALCNGQLLSIAQNTALFSLLGTTYGGNGQTTFALPNMQSRHGVDDGNGTATGGANYDLGEQGGQEAVTLVSSEMPAHTHQARAHVGTAADSGDPSSDSVWGVSTTALYATAMPSQQSKDVVSGLMAANALGVAGASVPHVNQPPLLVLNYIIALVGIFPARN